MNRFKTCLTDESGQDMVEYGLLSAFISIIAIGALRAIGPLVLAALQIKDGLRAASL